MPESVGHFVPKYGLLLNFCSRQPRSVFLQDTLHEAETQRHLSSSGNDPE